MASGGWRPTKGAFGIFGTANNSQARKAKDLGFSGPSAMNTFLENRSRQEDITKTELNVMGEGITAEGKFTNIETEKFGAQSDYDAAVRAFDQAETAKGIAETSLGDLDVGSYEDLTDEQKGDRYMMAQEDLASAELDRISGLAGIESGRGDITGRAISEERQAQQARMDSGLAYSGALEQNILEGKMAGESDIMSTQLDEIRVQDRFAQAELGFEQELQRIQDDWTTAKQAYDSAYDAMYGETGAQKTYDLAMKDADSKARLQIQEDTVLSSGLEGLKDDYINYWTLDARYGARGKSAATDMFEEGNVAYGRQGKYDDVGKDYGGFKTQYDDLEARYELAKDIYGMED